MDGRDQKPEIEFPTRWSYKVIGTDREAVAEAVRECVARHLGERQGERRVRLEPSRTSAQGKYVSWHLQLTVLSLEDRDQLFGLLVGHDDVRIVI